MASAIGTGNIKNLIATKSFTFFKFQTTVILKSLGMYDIVKGEEKVEDITDEKLSGMEMMPWARN